MSEGWRRRLEGVPAWLAAGTLFALLAVAITWPLAGQISTGIPLGTERVATVPLFNLWTLAWNAESLGRWYQGYWQAPIFHPVRDTFALSEPQPLTGLVAAVLAGLTGSVLTAYNLLLLAALMLNGLLAAVLLRDLGFSWLAALTGGALVEWLPFVHQELGVLQLVPLAGVLWLAIAVCRFTRTPSLSGGLVLGFALVAAYAVSVQTTVCFVLAAAPAVVWLWWPHLRSLSTWKYLVAGAAVSMVLLLPVLAAQMRAASGSGVERSLEAVRKHSARAAHYFVNPWPQLIPTPGVEAAEKPSRRAFWPGTLRVLLATVGAVAGLRLLTWRRGTIAALLLLASAVVLSLGPGLEIGGMTPMAWLRSLPGLAQIRSFFRFAFVAQLAIAGLAAAALELALRRRWRKPAVAHGAVAALALVTVLEMRPAMGSMQELPPLDLELPWLLWIDESTSTDDVLAFVPFPEGRTSRDYLGTAQWMYWQMRHWRPMVNGYSGFFPSEFRQLKAKMASFPSPESLQALHQAGVRYCVVHRAFAPPEAIARLPPGPFRLLPTFEDERHALDVYEIREINGAS